MGFMTYEQKMLELQIIGIVVTSLIAAAAFFYIALPTEWNSIIKGIISLVGSLIFAWWFGNTLQKKYAPHMD
jgi:hypothetical protein